MFDLTVSIVLYQNKREQLKAAIESSLGSRLYLKLYLIDNSPTDDLKDICQSPRCEYIFNNENIGFGKAHNVGMQRAVTESLYHLVLNPDVYFEGSVLDEIFAYMQQNPKVGQVMSKVLYPDGRVQHLCKLLPAPTDLFLRRFFPWFPGATERNRRYELIDSGYNKIMNIPYLSGCFMFFRCSVLREIGYFDERIFMYIEDVDLTRRVHKRFPTIFYPGTTVYHHYNKGSYKNVRLMLYNIHAAWIYFNKWGWIFDKERKRINNKVIQDYL